MIHVHRLDGCAPAPLAHYLKALGILRLVAEQADADARGWWDGDRFRLASKLTREELEAFFLHDYQPTPLVSPWNKGAGFFSEKDPALLAIQESKSQRFSVLRSGISASRSQLDELSSADRDVRDIKAETKVRGRSTADRNRIRASENYRKRLREAEKRFKRLKADLIPSFRLNWRGAHREWMDAAMVLGDNGTPKYPALLGTGGNDGRLDFTNNFMKRIGEVFDLDSDDGHPLPVAPAWVQGALWNTPVPGILSGKPVGQYLPGTAGGANNANGPDSDSLMNPMDFIMMLEGTIVFASSASRRFGSSESARASSPFAVNAVERHTPAPRAVTRARVASNGCRYGRDHQPTENCAGCSLKAEPRSVPGPHESRLISLGPSSALVPLAESRRSSDTVTSSATGSRIWPCHWGAST